MERPAWDSETQALEARNVGRTQRAEVMTDRDEPAWDRSHASRVAWKVTMSPCWSVVAADYANVQRNYCLQKMVMTTGWIVV
jgi:hypothetical protein